MKYTIGEDVHVRVSKQFEDGKAINVGACGQVVDVYTIFSAYLVKFVGVSLARLIPEQELGKGCPR